MKNTFEIGDRKSFSRVVTSADEAKFDAGTVHHVYATFALARDAEWTCRLFVLEMKESHEEGIGTLVNVEHVSPAITGSTIDFIATIRKLNGNEIICSFEAKVNERLIASGEVGQKIIERDKLNRIFSRLKEEKNEN